MMRVCHAPADTAVVISAPDICARHSLLPISPGRRPRPVREVLTAVRKFSEILLKRAETAMFFVNDGLAVGRGRVLAEEWGTRLRRETEWKSGQVNRSQSTA